MQWYILISPLLAFGLSSVIKRALDKKQKKEKVSLVTSCAGAHLACPGEKGPFGLVRFPCWLCAVLQNECWKASYVELSSAEKRSSLLPPAAFRVREASLPASHIIIFKIMLQFKTT